MREPAAGHPDIDCSIAGHAHLGHVQARQFGSRRRDYEVSFVEPWFLDRKLQLGVDLYRSELDYDDYELDKLGAGG